MRILVVEDDARRAAWFVHEFAEHDLVLVNTAREAIAILKFCQFEFLFLDHDLGNRTFVKTGDENCGQRVADFLAGEMDPPPNVVIHSWNPEGAETMLETLRRAKLPVRQVPFGSFGKSIVYDFGRMAELA